MTPTFLLATHAPRNKRGQIYFSCSFSPLFSSNLFDFTLTGLLKDTHFISGLTLPGSFSIDILLKEYSVRDIVAT